MARQRKNVVEKALETVDKRRRKLVGRHAVLSEVVNEDVRQKKGKVKTFSGEPAVIRVSMGNTLNMGNYQSLRLGVDLALPCSPAEVEVAFERASRFVEEKLNSLTLRHAPGAGPTAVEEDVEL